MKKLFVVLTAMAFVMAMGLPAMADVSVFGTIDKDKDKIVYEDVQINKAIYLGVKQIVKPSNSAEAQAIKNDVNQGNKIIEERRDPVPPTYVDNDITTERFELDPGSPMTPITKDASIDTNSFDDATGIVGVNQSPGSINNQGNATAVSYGGSAIAVKEVVYKAEGETRFVGGTFLHAESSVEQINGGTFLQEGDDITAVNTLLPVGNKLEADGTIRTNTIDNAFKDITGIAGVNQSAGNMNNQDNGVSLSVGVAIASLCEADLGMVNTGNKSEELATATTDTLSNSAFAGASGIIGVNQSSGCMNNQANVVAVCAVTSAGVGF